MQRRPLALGESASHPGLLMGMNGLEAPWLAEVNPGFDRQPVRQANCENTAMAVNEWLAGNPLSALPEPELSVRPMPLGQRVLRRLKKMLRLPPGHPASAVWRTPLDQAYGGRFEATTLPRLEAWLADLGDGARGIVRMNFSDGLHHHFNAVVHDGRVILIDGQVNRTAILDPERAAYWGTLYEFTREQSEMRAHFLETDDTLALELQVALATGNTVAAAWLLHNGSSLQFMRTDTLELDDTPRNTDRR